MASLTVVVLYLLSLTDSSTAWKAFGKVLCNGHPLSHVNVKLVKRSKTPPYREILGSVTSRTRGIYDISRYIEVT